MADLYMLWKERGEQWERILRWIDPSAYRLAKQIESRLRSERMRDPSVILIPSRQEIPGFTLEWNDARGYHRALRIEVDIEREEGSHYLNAHGSVWYDVDDPERGRVRKGHGQQLARPLYIGDSTNPVDGASLDQWLSDLPTECRGLEPSTEHVLGFS